MNDDTNDRLKRLMEKDTERQEQAKANEAERQRQLEELRTSFHDWYHSVFKPVQRDFCDFISRNGYRCEVEDVKTTIGTAASSQPYVSRVNLRVLRGNQTGSGIMYSSFELREHQGKVDVRSSALYGRGGVEESVPLAALTERRVREILELTFEHALS